MYYDIFEKREQQIHEVIAMINAGCKNPEIYRVTKIDRNSLRTLRVRCKKNK